MQLKETGGEEIVAFGKSKIVILLFVECDLGKNVIGLFFSLFFDRVEILFVRKVSNPLRNWKMSALFSIDFKGACEDFAVQIV